MADPDTPETSGDAGGTARRASLSPALVGVLLTVFLDLLSFGLFIPDLQLRGEQLAAKQLGVPAAQASANDSVGWMVGLLIAGFSLAQLFSSPILGRLSDRIGRRPVLLATCALSVVSYAMYANADVFWLSLGSRVLAGIAAANLGVAFAYVADVTAPTERAKGLGLVGAALGLGFIFGPVLGGQLIRIGNDSPALLGYVGAFLALINFLYIQFGLKESITPGQTASRPSFFAELRIAFTTPRLVLLLGMTFAFNFGFAMLQATFFRLIADERSVFHLPDAEAKTIGSYVLGLVGICGAIVQGVILPRIQSRYGEVNLVRLGMLMLVPGLLLVPFSPLWLPMILVVALQGFGSGLAQPNLSSLVSRFAPRELQGGIFGVTQALGATARLLAPLLANPLFSRNPTYPYVLAAAIVLFPAVAAWALRPIPAAEPAVG
ncbi:MAG: MFS transporter [Fimbriimonadaceae bacterium]|nr:MFS transporter [Fimbriimonadaceae bacterium]